MKLPAGKPPIALRGTTWLRGKIDAPHVPYGLCGHRDSFEDRADHQANKLGGRAAKRYRKLERKREKIQLGLSARKSEIAKIESEAGDEPVIRPSLSVWLYYAMVALAAFGEFQLSAITFEHVTDFGSRGVALVLALVFTIITVFAADRAGEKVGRSIHSRESGNKIVMWAVFLLGVPLIVAIGFARFEGVSTWDLLNQFLANPLSGDPASLNPSDSSKLIMLAALLTMSLGLIGLAGIARLDSEFGGKRYGLAKERRRSHRLETRLTGVKHRIELLRAKCEVILRKIETGRDHLERIYRSSYQKRVARAARTGRASGEGWTRERVLGTAARELEERRRERMQKRHDFVWKQVGGTKSVPGNLLNQNGAATSAREPHLESADAAATGVRLAEATRTYVNGEGSDQ